MAIKSGTELGGKLLEILGLPKNTVAFTLRCAVNEIATVTCEYYPEFTGQEGFDTVFGEYRLEKIK